MKMVSIGVFLLTAASVTAMDPPMPFVGKVVGVSDGDTITVLFAKTPHKIRLIGIDAPESSQAFGSKAKQALSQKVFGKNVTVRWKEKDRYGRILGAVYLKKRWINHEMVADGFAWHYVQYSTDRDLAAAEATARSAKKGLWSDPSPIAPWNFRNEKGVRNHFRAIPEETTVGS